MTSGIARLETANEAAILRDISLIFVSANAGANDSTGFFPARPFSLFQELVNLLVPFSLKTNISVLVGNQPNPGYYSTQSGPLGKYMTLQHTAESAPDSLFLGHRQSWC